MAFFLAIERVKRLCWGVTVRRKDKLLIAAPHEADWINFGPYTLFPRERRLQCDGKDIRIGGKALDLLVTLIARPGEFYSKADLAEQVWHREWVEDITVRVAVSNLRKVLGAPTAGGDFII